MAEPDSWPSIHRHGLLSTAALLDLFEADAEKRAAARRHRHAAIRLEHPAHGAAVIRDQRTMSETVLRSCLDPPLTPAAWYTVLNRRVFFWLSPDRLETLLRARPYRGRAHLVVEVDTAALVTAYRTSITLSPINSGAPFALGPKRRGPSTFQAIETYDAARGWPVELTVDRGVPDIMRFVRRVTLRRASLDSIETLFDVDQRTCPA